MISSIGSANLASLATAFQLSLLGDFGARLKDLRIRVEEDTTRKRS